jgi:transcriptional regulator with XRE-family HTH domain
VPAHADHDNRDLGALIVRLRKDRGLTQSALAAAIGLKHGSLSRIERGEVANPKATTLEALARELGVPELRSHEVTMSGRSAAWTRSMATLTKSEEIELLDYLRFIRRRGRSDGACR